VKPDAARLDFDGGDRHRHRLLRDHHGQKFRSALSPTAGLKPSQLPAPPAECPGHHPEAPCDLAHLRPALDLAEGALPEFALVTDDGHAPSFPRSRATREASIRGRLLRGALALDPYGGQFFVFVGKRGDRIKVLFWDRGGFVVYYKRLARGRFQLPRMTAGADRVVLDGTQLAMLLGGFDPVRTRRTEAWEPTTRRGAA
jgi:transposase